MSFSSVTSTIKLKTHSPLTQSPFTGTDCLSAILNPNYNFLLEKFRILAAFYWSVCFMRLWFSMMLNILILI